MHGVIAVKPKLKTALDIEVLLIWAYLHELPKRQLSSSEGIRWNRLEKYGFLGGINPDPNRGSAQRYPFGLPHIDAERIEKAVDALQPVTTDWEQYFELIAWDLAALVSVNDVRPVTRETIWTSAKVATGIDKRGVTASPDKPRDVLDVQSIDVGMLVYSHAVKGTRPGDWRTAGLQAVPTAAERGPLAKVVGLCKGKNSYSSGSYCPLRWEPSPVKVVLARAAYFAWHQALEQLAAELELAEHIALPPAISGTPWVWLSEPCRRIFHQLPIRSRPLPLKPTRKYAIAKPKPKRDRGRSIGTDKAV